MNPSPRPRLLAAALGMAVFALSACASGGAASPGAESLRATASTPDRSMIFVHRVEGGFLLVDLGWLDADDFLEERLEAMGGPPVVIAVLLTHSHRDHIGGWRRVKDAPFHMALPEVERFFGEERHRGWIPRVADRVLGHAGPLRDEVEVRPFAADTALVFGADTVHAFLVPGHTAGSAAYLIDGLLLAGDAIYRSYIGDFRPAAPGYSDDPEEARRSLGHLFERLEGHRVDEVCTAHGRCAPYTEEFRERVLRRR